MHHISLLFLRLHRVTELYRLHRSPEPRSVSVHVPAIRLCNAVWPVPIKHHCLLFLVCVSSAKQVHLPCLRTSSAQTLPPSCPHHLDGPIGSASAAFVLSMWVLGVLLNKDDSFPLQVVENYLLAHLREAKEHRHPFGIICLATILWKSDTPWHFSPGMVYQQLSAVVFEISLICMFSCSESS